jgi:predicted dehydrogenase
VVATPGPAHIEAAGMLEGVAGRILVEKPLGYTREDFARWLVVDAARLEGVYCCHSSRYRRNVLDMLVHLRRYNSGRLIHAQVEFQSPPVAWDPALWLRAERRSATLLLDYGIHLLDIASMFAQGEPELRHCSYQLNGNRETELIKGSAAFKNYTVGFVLRQGLFPRKGSVRFTFQNYSVHLGFSPDVFVPVMTDDNFGRSLKEARRQITETGRKALAALTGRDIDRAHDHVIAGLSAQDEATGLRVIQLKPVYDLLFAIKDCVYIAR